MQNELTKSEIEYIRTCWEQMFSKAYPNFDDYLEFKTRSKKITGSVYN